MLLKKNIVLGLHLDHLKLIFSIITNDANDTISAFP